MKIEYLKILKMRWLLDFIASLNSRKISNDEYVTLYLPDETY